MHNPPKAQPAQTSRFQFNDSAVRTVTKSDGSIWFVAADIAQSLEYVNSHDALRKHVHDDDKSTVRIASSTKGVAKREYLSEGLVNHEHLGKNPQTFNIINESGMYSLVLRSKKPQAKKFHRWVTSEVLPSIRRTGSYTTRQIPANDIPDFRRVIAKVVQIVAEGDGQRCLDINKLKLELFGCAAHQSQEQTLDIVSWLAEQRQLLRPQIKYADGFHHEKLTLHKPNKNNAKRQDVLIELEAVLSKTRDFLKEELL